MTASEVLLQSLSEWKPGEGRQTLVAPDLGNGWAALLTADRADQLGCLVWELTLRRAGPPYRGKPGKLAKRLDLSSGAMTNRLDNMEVRGLIRRLDDPDDRRGVIVELTDAGRELWDATVAAQAEKESLVDSVLGEREKRQLNDLLRRLMHAFEDVHGPVHPPHD